MPGGGGPAWPRGAARLVLYRSCTYLYLVYMCMFLYIYFFYLDICCYIFLIDGTLVICWQHTHKVTAAKASPLRWLRVHWAPRRRTAHFGMAAAADGGCNCWRCIWQTTTCCSGSVKHCGSGSGCGECNWYWCAEGILMASCGIVVGALLGGCW